MKVPLHYKKSEDNLKNELSAAEILLDVKQFANTDVFPLLKDLFKYITQNQKGQIQYIRT